MNPELQKIEKELKIMKTALKQYKVIANEDNEITPAEQARMDDMLEKIDLVEKELANYQITDGSPIEKKMAPFIDLSLATYIYIRVWDLEDLKGPTLLSKKIELNDETDFPSISVPSNSKIEVNTWAKAFIKEFNFLDFNDIEILQKDFFATIEIDKNGRFCIKDSNEKVSVNNSKILEDFDISLNIEYVSGGESIRVQADGFASEKTLEETYISIDTIKHKDTQTFKEQILKSISPSMKFIAEKYIPKTPISTELVFEKEDQAIVSSDQLRVLQNWWKQLNPELKIKVENQDAYIKLIGFTTTTGDDLYNHKLGKDRALDVQKLLFDIIGTNSEGKSIADIRCSSEGESSDNPDRYVKILVIER